MNVCIMQVPSEAFHERRRRQTRLNLHFLDKIGWAEQVCEWPRPVGFLSRHLNPAISQSNDLLHFTHLHTPRAQPILPEQTYLRISTTPRVPRINFITWVTFSMFESITWKEANSRRSLNVKSSLIQQEQTWNASALVISLVFLRNRCKVGSPVAALE